MPAVTTDIVAWKSEAEAASAEIIDLQSEIADLRLENVNLRAHLESKDLEIARMQAEASQRQ
eukprot:11087128-Karenia_brevis.AAC.1